MEEVLNSLEVKSRVFDSGELFSNKFEKSILKTLCTKEVCNRGVACSLLELDGG